MTDTNALVVRGLKKSYGDVVAVDGLDLEVRNGECFGLLGPNGAGKTTTIEICEGLLASDAGEVVVLGQTWEANADDLRERLGISFRTRSSRINSPCARRLICSEVFIAALAMPRK